MNRLHARRFCSGLGVGRAVTKNFAVQAGYVNYVAGEKTFNRAFNIGFTYIFGAERVNRKGSPSPEKNG